MPQSRYVTRRVAAVAAGLRARGCLGLGRDVHLALGARALHLGGREHGGLVYDIRDPKSPFADKFLMAAGHCANTNYALWMVLYGAMRKQHAATGDERFRCPEVLFQLSFIGKEASGLL